MNRWLAVLLLIGLAGCARAPVAGEAPAKTAAPARPAVPANDLLLATLWTQRAAEHDYIFEEVYRNAREKLAAALADPEWDALPKTERDTPARGLPPAVILDVDETALDNSPYEARLVKSGTEYEAYSWSKWCKEEKAKALPGALAFTRYAADHGIKVFYLTNRATDLEKATLENLRNEGFPVDDDAFLGLGVTVKGCEQIGTDKSCRRILIGRGYRVLMQFGDQLGDFAEVVSNTPEHRAEGMKPYESWVGERWWMLPNTMYGSWLPAQFNNVWAQPLEVRRKAVIDALDTATGPDSRP